MRTIERLPSGLIVERRKGSPTLTYKEKRDEKREVTKRCLNIMFPKGKNSNASKNQLINQSLTVSKRYKERYK